MCSVWKWLMITILILDRENYLDKKEIQKTTTTATNKKCPQWHSCIHNKCFSPVPKQEHLWFHYRSSYQTIKEGCCREAGYGVAGPDKAWHQSAPSAHRHNSTMWRSAISSLLTIALLANYRRPLSEGSSRWPKLSIQFIQAPVCQDLRFVNLQPWGIVRKRGEKKSKLVLRCQITAGCK